MKERCRSIYFSCCNLPNVNFPIGIGTALQQSALNKDISVAFVPLLSDINTDDLCFPLPLKNWNIRARHLQVTLTLTGDKMKQNAHGKVKTVSNEWMNSTTRWLQSQVRFDQWQPLRISPFLFLSFSAGSVERCVGKKSSAYGDIQGEVVPLNKCRNNSISRSLQLFPIWYATFFIHLRCYTIERHNIHWLPSISNFIVLDWPQAHFVARQNSFETRLSKSK